MTQVTLNGNTYSDDGTSPKDMNNGGFRDHLLPLMRDGITEIAGWSAAVGLARDQAAAAASSAASAPGTIANSSTSLSIGIGSRSLTIQAGKLFAVGQTVYIASTASPLNWMAGTVTAINTGTGAMTVSVSNIGGSGTFAAWTVSISGPAGVTGVLNELAGASIAAAATVNLDAATGNFIHITGNTTIQAITLAQGAERTVVFDAILTLGNSANLILPGRANIAVAAGDCAVFRGEAGAVVRCISYDCADGTPDVYRNGHMPRVPVTVAASNIDCYTGSEFIKTVNGNTTFTFSNIPLGRYTMTLEVDHVSGIIAFPASVKPRGGVMPTLTPGKRHYFMLTTCLQGASWGLSVSNNH